MSNAAQETLQRAGLYFDDLNKIKIVSQENVNECNELHKNCEEFVQGVDSLQEIITRMLTTAEQLSKQVEMNKLKAIGTRNAVDSVTRATETDKQQLVAVIGERTNTIQRLQRELAALELEESEQAERIRTFLDS